MNYNACISLTITSPLGRNKKIKHKKVHSDHIDLYFYLLAKDFLYI
jgi:hypothetical protein